MTSFSGPKARIALGDSEPLSLSLSPLVFFSFHSLDRPLYCYYCCWRKANGYGLLFSVAESFKIRKQPLERDEHASKLGDRCQLQQNWVDRDVVHIHPLLSQCKNAPFHCQCSQSYHCPNLIKLSVMNRGRAWLLDLLLCGEISLPLIASRLMSATFLLDRQHLLIWSIYRTCARKQFNFELDPS